MSVPPFPGKQAKPPWLKVRPPQGAQAAWLRERAGTLKLATVCQEARCPNMGECWSGGTATFMVLGEVCSRGCRFCAVTTGDPQGRVDPHEPDKLAQTVREAGWDYVVITSVDRDDLPDGGAGHIARCIAETRRLNPQVLIETLIPDFQGDADALAQVVAARPDVIGQNLETVERLTHRVRDRRAGYQQTLDCLARVKALDAGILTKSSLMLGLGETDEEIHTAMADLRRHGVDLLTLGQYLQPTPRHLPVAAFVSPEAFKAFQDIAEHEYGFLYCAAGPLVRSSYRAGEYFVRGIIRKPPEGTRHGLSASDPKESFDVRLAAENYS